MKICVDKYIPLIDLATGETALLRVFKDFLLAADKDDEAVRILLDYSAAFDTINQKIFLDRLAKRYGHILTPL